MMQNHPENYYILVDKLTYAGDLNNLKEYIDPIEKKEIVHGLYFYEVDICDIEEMTKIFSTFNPSVCINFAAESHVDNSLKNPKIFLETNVIGVQTLLDLCVKYSCFFHQVSTDEVYGDLPLDKYNLQFTEDMPLKPHSPYSVSKASADMLVEAYVRSFGLKASISRCSNNYGPRQHREKLIPLTIGKIMNDEKIPVYGTGENVRDWLYVEDHCRAIWTIIQAIAIEGREFDSNIFNVGGNTEKPNLEIVKYLIYSLGKSDNLIEFVEDRKGHDLRYAIDATKMRRDLDWRPAMTFEEGIKKTIDWYVGNEE